MNSQNYIWHELIEIQIPQQIFSVFLLPDCKSSPTLMISALCLYWMCDLDKFDSSQLSGCDDYLILI